MTAKQMRIRTKKNRKKYLRKLYKRLKQRVYDTIYFSNNYHHEFRYQTNEEKFALWLIQKKLEKDGFKCTLTCCELRVSWN